MWDRIKTAFTASTFLGNFLLVLAITIPVFLFLPRSWAVNDDVSMMLDLSAGFRTPFLAAVLAESLSWLYLNLSGAIPWYPLLLLAVNLLSLAVMLQALQHSLADSKPVTPAIGKTIFLLMAVPNCFLFAFTITAILAAAAGMVLLVQWHKDDCRGLGRPFFFGIAITVSFLIRLDALLGVCMLMLPSLAMMLPGLRRRSMKWLLSVAATVFLLPMTVSLAELHMQGSASPANSEFSRINAVRGNYHHAPVQLADHKNNPVLLAANNWSPNDVAMLDNWLFYNEEKYSVATLSNIFAHTPPSARPLVFQRFSVGDTPSGLWFAAVWAWILIHCGGLVRATTDRTLRFGMIAFAGWSALVFTGLFLFARLPLRLSYPMHLLLFVVSTIRFIPSAAARTASARRVVPALVAVASFALFAFLAVTAYARNADNEKLRDLLRQHRPDAHLIVIPSVMPFSDPFAVDHDMHRTIPWSWNVFSERFYGVIRTELAVESGKGLLRAFVDQPGRMILVLQGDKGTAVIGNILTALEEWNGVHAEAILVRETRLAFKTVHWYRLVTRGGQDS